jgi:hypothetical protein
LMPAANTTVLNVAPQIELIFMNCTSVLSWLDS